MELEDEFEDELDIVGYATPSVTGELEVRIGGETGKLVHSKKNGDGYVDSKAKMAKIIAAVGVALKA